MSSLNKSWILSKPRKQKSLADKLWAKVQKTDGCWLWSGATLSFGHGRMLIGGRRNPKQVLAHRVAWELTNGKIPDTLCVLHKCDVPRCVNPEHLFLGTRIDNNLDRDRKGRGLKQI